MGLDGVSLRYFNIFGPRQDPSSPYSGVISVFARAMSEGRRPMIFGDGRQTRDFTYVANAVAANLAALRAEGPLDGAALNVGTGRQISLLDLVAAINAHPRDRPGARVPAGAAGRRPALAGEPRPDPRDARLPTGGRFRGGPAPDPGRLVSRATG